MDPRIALTSAILGAAVVAATVHLLRKRSLREDYSVLWFVLGLALIVLGLWEDAIVYVAKLTGVAYPPSGIFIVAFLVCLALFMHFSIVVSKLYRYVVRLTQECALLRVEIERSARARGLGHDLGMAERTLAASRTDATRSRQLMLSEVASRRGGRRGTLPDDRE